MKTSLLLVLKVWKQSSVVSSVPVLGTSLNTTLTAVAAAQSASRSSGIESFEDMRVLVLSMSATDKQVAPCHEAGYPHTDDGWVTRSRKAGRWSLNVKIFRVGQKWPKWQGLFPVDMYVRLGLWLMLQTVSGSTCCCQKRAILTCWELFIQLEVIWLRSPVCLCLTSVWRYFSSCIPVSTIDFLDWILTYCF